MWKNLSRLAVTCVLVAGCKNASVDEPAKKDEPDTTAQTGAGTRSGKVDLGSRRGKPYIPPAGDGSSILNQGDLDRREAFEDRKRSRIAQFDADGDGKISEDERKAARHKRAEDMRSKADADGNGKVTPDELAKGNFRRLDPESLDTNKDGDVSVEELETALDQRNRAWGGGRLRPDGRFGPRFKEGSGGKLGGTPTPAPSTPAP